MSQAPLATVAICTWNRSQLLRPTLEQFTRLRLPDGMAWELVVVNNNCTDQTPDVIREFEPRLPLRGVFEPQPGLSNARNRAVAEARGRYVVWTDDDVLVAEDWLAAYARAFEANPAAAVFGGPIDPWFTGSPPAWLTRGWKRVAAAYALCDMGPDPIPLTEQKLPYGANFAIRADVQKQHRFDPNLGRRPDAFLSGEETTLMRHLLAQGHTGVWVPDAKVRHYLPPDRQTVAYLRKYYHGIGGTERVLLLNDPTFRNGRKLFGRPLFYCRRAVTGEVAWRLKRWFGRDEEWLAELRLCAKAWGMVSKPWPK